MKIYKSLERAAQSGYIPTGQPALVVVPRNICNPTELWTAYKNAMLVTNHGKRYSVLCVNVTSSDAMLIDDESMGAPNAESCMFAQAFVTDKAINSLRKMDLEFHIIKALKQKSQISKR